MNSHQTLDWLRRYESRNVTFIEPDGSWPIVWARARGCHVWDAEGRRYLDLTAAFGVAAAGHSNRAVVRAGQAQMATLLHAMGDVHPHTPKAALARELNRVTFERWSRGRRKQLAGKTIFCNSGFEAVEAALKTALLATRKRRVVAFQGAYHGLGYGALNATHRQHFRGPFRAQLAEFCDFLPFPMSGGGDLTPLATVRAELDRLMASGQIGAVLVEPVQARGGIRVAPNELMRLLRRTCDAHGACLVFDEIYTGFGRAGDWFACEHSGVIPDLICLGKALTGGFPLSACVGRAGLMDAAWPASTGEAMHTSTFLGHPVGCAMALANILEIRDLKLVDRSRRLGERLLAQLRDEFGSSGHHLRYDVRGRGLMAGIEVRERDGAPATDICLRVIKEMLRRGFVLLPEGEHGNVISFTPPLTIAVRDLARAVSTLSAVLATLDGTQGREKR